MLTRFTTNIDCMKNLMPVLDAESRYINPQVGDTIAVRCDKQEIDMVVICRRWRGNTLWVELHHPSHHGNITRFEAHVKFVKSM